MSENEHRLIKALVEAALPLEVLVADADKNGCGTIAPQVVEVQLDQALVDTSAASSFVRLFAIDAVMFENINGRWPAMVSTSAGASPNGRDVPLGIDAPERFFDRQRQAERLAQGAFGGQAKVDQEGLAAGVLAQGLGDGDAALVDG